jgi:hypothetical protein
VICRVQTSRFYSLSVAGAPVALRIVTSSNLVSSIIYRESSSRKTSSTFVYGFFVIPILFFYANVQIHLQDTARKLLIEFFNSHVEVTSQCRKFRSAVAGVTARISFNPFKDSAGLPFRSSLHCILARLSIMLTHRRKHRPPTPPYDRRLIVIITMSLLLFTCTYFYINYSSDIMFTTNNIRY